MEMQKEGRSVGETLFIILWVTVSLILSVALYAKRDTLHKSRLMIWELLTLRNRVIAHMLEQKKYPVNLRQPQSGVEGEAPVALPLEGATRAPMTDPFGNAYQYDPKTGWVSSTTPGFESW